MKKPNTAGLCLENFTNTMICVKILSVNLACVVCHVTVGCRVEDFTNKVMYPGVVHTLNMRWLLLKYVLRFTSSELAATSRTVSKCSLTNVTIHHGDTLYFLFPIQTVPRTTRKSGAFHGKRVLGMSWWRHPIPSPDIDTRPRGTQRHSSLQHHPRVLRRAGRVYKKVLRLLLLLLLNLKYGLLRMWRVKTLIRRWMEADRAHHPRL